MADITADMQDLHELQESTAWDMDGRKLGTVGQVHLDAATGRPAWISVPLGLFESREKLIPLAGARFTAGAQVGDIHVAYSEDTIKDAPEIDVDKNLTPEQEAELRAHYGLDNP